MKQNRNWVKLDAGQANLKYLCSLGIFKLDERIHWALEVFFELFMKIFKWTTRNKNWTYWFAFDKVIYSLSYQQFQVFRPHLRFRVNWSFVFQVAGGFEIPLYHQIPWKFSKNCFNYLSSNEFRQGFPLEGRQIFSVDFRLSLIRWASGKTPFWLRKVSKASFARVTQSYGFRGNKGLQKLSKFMLESFK